MFNRATSLGTALTAGYRGDGLRAWKHDSAGNRTYYLYDGDSPLCEMDASGNWKGEFLYGPAGLISHSRSGLGTDFYTFDERSNVQAVYRDTGTLVSTRTYDAYGEQTGGIVVDATHDDSEIGYNGQCGYITDPETGLVLCGHRYYDPSAGRWLNRDPIGYSGGIGLYNYCANNPVMGVDTSGLQTGNPEVDPVINEIVPLIEADCPAVVAAENEGNTFMNNLLNKLASINSGGGTTNCIQCSRAVVNMLKTGAAQAAETGPEGLVTDLEDETGGSWVGSTPADVDSGLRAAGPGGIGYVYGQRAIGQAGHVFVGANIGGNIVYLDGQRGTFGNPLDPEFTNGVSLLVIP